MYSMPEPDSKVHTDPWLKWFRVLAYTSMGAAGGLLLLSPVLTTVYTRTAEVMSGFLLVGGVLAAIGAIREEWWGEFTGLPLLGSSFLVFGVLSWRGTLDTYPFIAWSNLLLLIGVSLAMTSRWRDARNIYRVANFAAKKEKQRRDENGDPL